VDDFKITVDIQDKELKDLLTALTKRATDLKPAMKEVGDIVRSSIIRNFEAGGRPERWQPNALSTIMAGRGRSRTYTLKGIVRKPQERKLQKSKVLMRTARLRNSIKHKAYSDRVEIGTNVIYGRIHQLGGKAGSGLKVTIPARPYLMVQDEDWPEIRTAIENYLIDQEDIMQIPVFRTGTHTDSNGNKRTWTEADLDRMVASYDPKRHEAPVVIGHPTDNAPAWGWVEALNRTGDTLYAKPKDLVPEFVDMVKKGMFKKRSISLYGDGTLRHIGFLGALPPAVKGLPDIQFGEGEAITIEFEEHKQHEGGRKMGVMNAIDWIKQQAGKMGVTIADPPESPLGATFSEAELQIKIEAARKEERDKAAQEFSEAGNAREKDIKAREEKIRQREIKAKKDDIAAFCEALQKEGTLTPAMMKVGMGMTNFLESIAAIETTIEFGEGDEKKKQAPIEFMQAFLRGLPKAIEFKEVATGDKDAGAGGDAAKREKLISDFTEKNPKASYKDAVLHVSKEHPELFRD
jgi:phage virion morphogenesis protein